MYSTSRVHILYWACTYICICFINCFFCAACMVRYMYCTLHELNSSSSVVLYIHIWLHIINVFTCTVHSLDKTVLCISYIYVGISYYLLA